MLMSGGEYQVKRVMLTVIVVLNQFLVTSPANSDELATPSIRDWSIRKQLNSPDPAPYIGVLYQPPPKGGFLPGLRPRASLRRPGSSNIVAVLNIDENGKIYFNPPGYIYGPIPAMKDLTPAQADVNACLKARICAAEAF